MSYHAGMATQSSRTLRGLRCFVHDSVDRTTDLVDLGHESTMRAVRRISDRIEPLRAPVRVVDGARRFITRGVLTTIKRVNRSVEAIGNAAFDVAESLSGGSQEGSQVAKPQEGSALPPDVPRARDRVGNTALGLVNAAVGDRLSEDGNGLDLQMVFRTQDHPLTLELDMQLDGNRLEALLPNASPKVALFVHGLANTEQSWSLRSETYHGAAGITFGSLLERDLGFTPIFLRYNTGRRVSNNGRLLATELQRFIDAYPVPIEDLTLVGHSMGGLVIRSACHYGALGELPWTSRVRRVVCLGSPHRGAPLAKLGHSLTAVLSAIDLPATQVIAKVLAGRSAGVQDLRHGALLDEDELDETRLPRPETAPGVIWLPKVQHIFVSSTVTENPNHPVGRLIGDLLVRVPSATGPALKTSNFAIDSHHHGGILHHHMQNHPAVYEQLRRACSNA